MSAALFAWAAVIALTGGFRIDVGLLRISSRNGLRVVLLAVLAAAAGWRIAYRDSLGIRQLLTVFSRLDAFLRTRTVYCERACAVLAWIAAGAVLACAIAFGSRVVGGADAFGYLSASALWKRGMLGIDQHALARLPWPGAAGSFVPLAYRLGAHDVIGPSVAPGLPLLMTLARTFSVCAPYVVPASCGAMLVVATFALGERLFNSPTALAAAVLVACSPVILFQSLVVMADVPAAAFWTVALTAALSARKPAALLAGALAGIAILIRPNLTPLALFPWLLVVLKNLTIEHAVRRTAAFAVFSVPAALFVGWINYRLYGSPFSSGYGDIGGAFGVDHASPNVHRYAWWWLESQGPAAFLFLLAPWWGRSMKRRERVVVVAYAACASLLYVFYLPFDQWWYLRFLAPAVPIVFLLCAYAVDRATAWSPSLRVAALAALVGVVASHSFSFIGSKDILTNSTAERRRYLDPALYLDSTLPRDAVVLAMQHSGSVRYYTGRLTMRWDVLDSASVDDALAALGERGLPVYALLESWEEEDFRRRFAGRRTLEALGNLVARTADDEARLYALDSRAHSGPVAVMPLSGGTCVDASPHFVYPDALRHLAAK